MRSKLVAGLGLATLLALTGCAGSSAVKEPSSPDLEMDDLITSLAEIHRAEDVREVDERLLAALSDSRPLVRGRAAVALGRIGDPASVPRLTDLLLDPEPSVRSEAAFSLGLIGDPATVPALSQAILDADPGVRAAVAAALGRLRVPEANQALEVLLLDKSPEVSSAACLAVSRLSDPSFALEILLRLAGSQDASIAYGATYSLARLTAGASSSLLAGSDRRRARARLRDLAAHPSPEVRMQVAKGLASPQGDAETSTLGLLFSDKNPRVRVNAVRSLSYPGAPVRPYLNRALNDPDLLVVVAAIEGLGRVRTDQSAQVLTEGIVRSRVDSLRAKALASLASSDPELALSAARRLFASPQPHLREAAVRILAGSGVTPSPADYRRLKAESNLRVLATAIPLLAIPGASLEESLGDIRFHEDPGVRAAVTRVAGKRIASSEESEELREEALALLPELWSRAQEDTIPYARLAVLDAVSRSGRSAVAREMLALGLEDRDPRVRARSIEHLKTVFEEVHQDGRPIAPERSLEEYERIVRWSLEPWAARVTVEREGFPPGWFTVRLDSARAPLTCWNFVQLARSGFYDGMVIHRVVPNFVVQAGDPRGDGHGGPGYTLRSEVSSVPFVAGTLGMTQIDGMTHGSQWFITLSAQSHLDGEYTAFGNVVLNLSGAVLLLEPGDRIVSIEVYRGNGTERPLPGEEGEEPANEVREEPAEPARPGS